MFTKLDCSFEAYRNLMRDIKESGKYCDYKDVIEDNREQYLVLRHDIEFSIDRAYSLYQLEKEEGICSSFFVQITNNAYNAFSDKNKKLLQEMFRGGAHIGLHYHRGEKTEIEDVKKDIVLQTSILEKMLEMPIDRFSFHRPLREHLAADLQIEGLINTYGKEFFVLTDVPEETLSVKYIADSNHQWKYGVPSRQTFEKYDKIQLLIHPLSWSKNGAEHVENFQMLVQEKHDEFVNTIEGEWKIFDMLRGKL